ncbi:uncharacterized protein LOC106663986 isoform X2 [Cimex lectularius]|uniref:UBX domain-containing protein 11 n=1 Tax=Cimex lectularius TaxID=79782 RepID=A0A8I6REP8_CIMLE|nr:uncharacterized protein LOC106663986 isoform X2 [Cimex lectularius]
MPKYPYSLGPVKQSSKINLTQRQTAKSTVVPLGSYHRAESYIESGLREKIKSLKEGKASTIIPLLSQRLSVIEQELRSIKSQLNEANHLIKEKDSEINYLRARLAQENKNSVINNGQPKLSDEAKNEKAKAKSFDTSKERSIKNGESSSPNKEQRQQKGEIPHSVRNGESSSPNKEPRDAQIKGESPRSIKNGESSSPNKEPRDLQVKGESPRSIRNGESSSPNKEPRVLQVKGESPRSIRNGESSSPNKEQRDPEVKGESPSSRKHSRSSSPKNGQRDPQMNKERPVSRKGPCNPNVAIVRPGSHKAEYKDLRNGQLTDVDCDEPDSSTSSDSSRIQNLEKENQQLQQKISELEKFIGEYGLMWVGDKALTEENVSRPGTSENLSQGMTTIKSRAEVKLNFNLDNAITVISELNQSVPEQNIVKSPFGAKFQKCDILELKLYADGMKLEDNPFRKYDTPSAEAFFKDLEDGYFPSELKSRHPQGVIFKVVDNRQCTYEESNEDIKPTPFAGKGFRLGGEDKISVSNESDDTDFTDNSKQENRDSNNSKGKSKKKTSDKEQFVPKKVAKNIKEQNHKNSPSPKSHGSPDSIVRTGMTENMANRKLSHTTNVKNGKHNRDLGESSIASDQSELKEYWVNKHPPRPSTNVILNDNPPSIEMPSVPMEINLPPRESSSLPPTFTQAVPFKMQEEVPLKPSVSTVRPFSSNGPRVPTEPKVQIEQPNQADTDNWKNRAPINITNITYHEAPVTYQIGGDDRCMHTIRPNVNVRPEIPAACKCGHTQPKRPQRNETCPGTCGKVGVTQQPSMNVMCPCDCGGQADLHLQLPDKPKTPTTPVNEGYLQPIKFKGRTEYEDNYSRSALFRLNNLPQVQSTMDSVRPAGVPSSTPRQKIDPYEKFEHFTYLGRPKDDAAHLTQRPSTQKSKRIELNKKTSESMITVILRSDKSTSINYFNKN